MGTLICLAFSLVLLMGDPFRTLTPGDPVGAGEGPFNSHWHNMATEAIRVSQRATPPGMTPDEVVKERDTEIWIANITEADIDEYRPAGLGDLAIYPSDDGDFRERLCFLTQKLKSGRPFGIVQQPVGAGRFYACKLATGPGGQPPNKKWMRLVGDPEPWDVLRTYLLGEQVNYIGPASPWADGNSYVVGDRVDVGGIVYRCVAAHVASPGNAPPEAGHWDLYEGKKYISLVKHAGKVPPTNPSYWLPSGPHRGIWNKGDTYATGDVVVEPQLGRIIIDGVSRAWLNVKQAAHQHAKIVGGELQSATDGPVEVLWRQGGLGNQWAVVRLCCDSGLTLPVATSTGDATIPAMTCDGVGQFIYRPGGALIMGAMNLAGAGTHTYPARTGSGAPSLAVMRSYGNGNVYTPTPSGSLFTAQMSLSGAGTRTTPPSGNGNLKAGAMNCAGIGTRSVPTRTGSGSFALPALACFSSAGSGGGSVTVAAMFVAKMTNPVFQGSTGRWIYDWIEQTINPSNGDYQDLAGGKAGSTSAGPFMRERNNTLVGVPLFSLARLRGAWSGQPLYDFEHCCSKRAAAASGSLMLGPMTCEGSGLFVAPPPKVGAGSLVLASMACAGNGLSSAYTVSIGIGNLQAGAMSCAGAGLSSAYSVNVGTGNPQFAAITCASSGSSTPPHFVATGSLQFGAMVGSGVGLSSEFSVSIGTGLPPFGVMTCAASGLVTVPTFTGVGSIQLGAMIGAGNGLSSANTINLGGGTLLLRAMVCNGTGSAWINTTEVTQGGIAAGGGHQILVDLGTDGGVAAGGKHEVMTDLGVQGGVAAGGRHENLSDLGVQGGVAAGGTNEDLSDLSTDGGVAAGGTHGEGGGDGKPTRDV